MDSTRVWPRVRLSFGRMRGARRSARARTTAIGALIVVVGIAAWLLADRWRESARDANHSAFASSAAELSHTLDAKLNANVSLLRALRAIAMMEPSIGDARFAQCGIESCSGASLPRRP